MVEQLHPNQPSQASQVPANQYKTDFEVALRGPLITSMTTEGVQGAKWRTDLKRVATRNLAASHRLTPSNQEDTRAGRNTQY